MSSSVDNNFPMNFDNIKKKSTPWNKLPLDLQYKIVLELEDGSKTQSQICEENDIGKKTAYKLKKNAEQVKFNVKKAAGKVNVEKKVYKMRASLTPIPANICKVKSKKNSTQSSIKIETGQEKLQNKKPKKKIETLNIHKPLDTDYKQNGPQTLLRPSGKTADWDEYLLNGNNLYYIPPVSMFKHAPLTTIWNEYAVTGRVFEVTNPFLRRGIPVNWFARVIHFAGYKALIEFECFDNIPKYITWMSYCSDLPKPIGYSEKNGIILQPPDQIRVKYPDFLMRAKKEILKKSTVTLSSNHGEETLAEIKKIQKYGLNTVLEVMDKLNINRMKLARVTAVIGDRIHVKYIIEPTPNDMGFWMNVNSDLVQPLGWSYTIGHELYGVPKSNEFLQLNPNYFPKYPDSIKLVKGQLLEVRHPLVPRQICAAIVHNVLRYGYFTVEIRVMPWEVRLPTKFTFHVTSPYIFYCGFAQKYGIKITPPYGESLDIFNWDDYIRRFNLIKAPLHFLPKRSPHNFQPGMKMEGIDITNPIYLGPCTILKVAGHLLYIHLDGWEKNSKTDPAEIWVDAESPDIYPIGFAEMVGHEFQGSVELFNESVDSNDMKWLTDEMNTVEKNVEKEKDGIIEQSVDNSNIDILPVKVNDLSQISDSDDENKLVIDIEEIDISETSEGQD